MSKETVWSSHIQTWTEASFHVLLCSISVLVCMLLTSGLGHSQLAAIFFIFLVIGDFPLNLLINIYPIATFLCFEAWHRYYGFNTEPLFSFVGTVIGFGVRVCLPVWTWLKRLLIRSMGQTKLVWLVLSSGG